MALTMPTTRLVALSKTGAPEKPGVIWGLLSCRTLLPCIRVSPRMSPFPLIPSSGANGGKAECLEGMAAGTLGRAQGEGPHALGQWLLQPEKCHILGFSRPEPLRDHRGQGSAAPSPEDKHHICTGLAIFGLGCCGKDMGAGDRQVFGHHEAGSCRLFVRAQNPYDA